MSTVYSTGRTQASDNPYGTSGSTQNTLFLAAALWFLPTSTPSLTSFQKRSEFSGNRVGRQICRRLGNPDDASRALLVPQLKVG